MFYEQKVLLKNIEVLKVINSFHDKSFVKFLITLQPVKIISWDGIEDGKEAVFKFWLFGWKTMKVVHKSYVNRDQYLSFEDKGIEIPFGLSTWNHHHIVETQKNKFGGVSIFSYTVFKNDPIYSKKMNRYMD